MPREQGRKVIAQNRRARHDYHIEDTFEAGLVLTGTEVKSLRAGRANLTDGYAHIRDGEVWLEGVHIPEYTQGTWTNHAARRPRKLLLHRREIGKLIDTMNESGLDASSRSPCTSRTGGPRSRSRWRAASAATTSGRPSPNGTPTVRWSAPARRG